MDLGAVAMGLVFSLMWSSAFATGRILVHDAVPLHMLAARFLISGGVAIALARVMGQTWRLTRPQLRAVLVFGLCQNALYLGLNFVALQWVEASLAVIIAATMPLLVAGLGWITGAERVGRLGLVGLIAGFAGVALIMATRVEGGASLWGV
ncbi:MAG: EamA family transporter, partial [Rhodobacteraceae bacterium]|nr:EamA family transporter [Paracoccaceae bacterium]